MLHEGDVAPDFEGELDDNERFHLSDLRGKKNVVLYFYPADFTGGCTAEACAFQENYGAVEKFEAVIVGVSADSSESHRDFRDRYSLGFPLIADPDKTIIRAYGATGRFGIRPRITYVIDMAGVVRSVIRHDIAVGRHLPDVLDALAKLES